jgi:hypothetical protein
VSRFAITPLSVALSPVRKNITRFRPSSPIAKGNHLDPAENLTFSQTNDILEFFDPLSVISGPTSRRVSACPDLHE